MSAQISGLRHEVGVIMGFAAITATALLAAPAIAAQLASQWHLAPTSVGLYFTVEQAGMCLATLPGIWWLRAVSWRLAATVAMLLFIVANLASAIAPGFGGLLLLRAISSLSGGSLMVLSMTIAGSSPDRERLFGLWVLGQLGTGAVLLATLPRLFALFGLSALYIILASLMAAALFLLPNLPAKVAAAGGIRRKVPLDFRTLIPSIGAVLLYYTGYGGIWPFMATIARSGGANAIASGAVLAVGSLFGVAGACLATVLSRRKGQGVLAGGCALLVLAVLLLLNAPSLTRFAGAAFLLKGATNFTLPFILGRVAAFDRDGRVMGLANLAIGGGLAIGPLVAGGIIGHGGGLAAMIGLCALLILASTGLILSLGASTVANDGKASSNIPS